MKDVPSGAVMKGSSTLVLNQIRGQDAGIYICKANNSQTESESKTVLTVDGLIPKFVGNSYLALDELKDAYLSFEISVAFKPEASNGLIFYKQGASDFISLHLKKAVPIFKFDLGSGTATLSAGKPVILNEWNVIKIERDRRNATLTLNRNLSIYGTIGGRFQGLDLDSPFFIGGHPKTQELGYETDFKGCISQLIINSKLVNLAPSQCKVAYGVELCKSCMDVQCDNGGICQEAQNDQGHVCLCQSGFSGDQCEKEGLTCYPGACGESGKCVDTTTGFECKCSIGYAGDFCQEQIVIDKPYFNEEAYLAVTEPRHILRT